LTGSNYLADESAHVAYYVVLTIAAASLSYHLLENPARRLGHHLASRLFRDPRPGPVPSPS
jgi:peptidoglycan/LPS O-acetylase OafA/YrhL